MLGQGLAERHLRIQHDNEAQVLQLAGDVHWPPPVTVPCQSHVCRMGQAKLHSTRTVTFITDAARWDDDKLWASIKTIYCKEVDMLICWEHQPHLGGGGFQEPGRPTCCHHDRLDIFLHMCFCSQTYLLPVLLSRHLKASVESLLSEWA